MSYVFSVLFSAPKQHLSPFIHNILPVSPDLHGSVCLPLQVPPGRASAASCLPASHPQPFPWALQPSRLPCDEPHTDLWQPCKDPVPLHLHLHWTTLLGLDLGKVTLVCKWRPVFMPLVMMLHVVLFKIFATFSILCHYGHVATPHCICSLLNHPKRVCVCVGVCVCVCVKTSWWACYVQFRAACVDFGRGQPFLPLHNS